MIEIPLNSVQNEISSSYNQSTIMLNIPITGGLIEV